MQKSEAINELATALAKAQGQIQDAKKDSSNPYFKSQYADLASVWEACRKPLSDNGLAVVQTIEVKESKRILESTLIHSSGQWLSSSLDLLPKEETEQALGSAITYTRRYALSALVGICPDDDDGEGAMARTINKSVQPPTPTSKNQARKAVAPPPDTPQPEKKEGGLKLLDVYNALITMVSNARITQDVAKEKLASLGGKGINSWIMIESLTPEKLAELDKWITSQAEDADIPF